MEKQNSYICIANDNQNKYSRFARIVTYEKNGKSGQFLDNKPISVQGVYPIGSIKNITTSVSVD